MIDLSKISLEIQKYKCFQSPQVVEEILPINIIIGKNNSGKSAFLEIINYLNNPLQYEENKVSSLASPLVYITKPFEEDEIEKIFPRNSSGELLGGNYYQYGIKRKDELLKCQVLRDGFGDFKILPKFDKEEAIKIFKEKGVKSIINPLSKKILKRLKAERDVVPEGNNLAINLSSNGEGATRLVESFLNDEDKDTFLIKKKFLNELNKIFYPDSAFEDIVIQRLKKNSLWEICLEEKEKGLIKLSDSGSGLKTVFLVLINTIIVPALEQKKLSEYIFTFEELENNLHPGLQRKLFAYIKDIAISEKATFFITTHSNVVIDSFSKDDKAQLFHIEHDGNHSNIKKVKTYIQNKEVLDDLDVRASDLLQANGIIWLEGPSDRIYFNKWIEIFSNGELKEGLDYQCVFYGGRLLAHLNAGEIEGIDILKVNKNIILLMDSDKKNDDDKIGDTKERIINEIAEVKGFSWVTAGKEIENYIPKEATQQLFNLKSINDVEQYNDFFDILDKSKEGLGKKYYNKKPVLAEMISPYFTIENLQQVYDLKEKMEEVCEIIKSWNGK